MNSLIEAIRTQNAADVKGILEAGFNVNAKVKEGLTPLQLAVELSKDPTDTAVFDLLLAHRADPNIKAINGVTALEIAFIRRRYHIVRRLLDHGANVKYRLSNKRTALHLAASTREVDIIQSLAQRGVDVNATNETGFTALHVAASHNLVSSAQTLIQLKANINTCTDSGMTPLHTAATHANPDFMQLLLSNRADCNALSCECATTLTLAVSCTLEPHPAQRRTVIEGKVERSEEQFQADKLRCLRLLLEAKADPNSGGVQAPLLFAVNDDLVAEAELLLQFGADVEVKSISGESQLLQAAEGGSVAMTNLLLDYGANINARTRCQTRAALDTAVLYNRTAIVQLLIDRKADINAGIEHSKLTALHRAIEKGYMESARLLLKHGGTINKQCSNTLTQSIIETRGPRGESLLHAAVECGRNDLTGLLIKLGADVNARDMHGRAPLHYAVHLGNTIGAQILIRMGAPAYAIADSGRIPLHIAAYNGATDLATILIDASQSPLTDVNAATRDCRTPLHSACQNGRRDVAEILVSYRANINAVSANGYTPLYLASLNGHLNVVKYLLSFQCDSPNNTTTSKSKDQDVPLPQQTSLSDIQSRKDEDRQVIDVNIALRCGSTPLHRAAQKGYDNITAHLVTDGRVSIDARDYRQRTPLHLACSNVDGDSTVSCLLLHKADCNARDIHQRTPLFYAQTVSIIKLLLEEDADLFLVDENNHTAADVMTNPDARDFISHMSLLMKHGNTHPFHLID